MNGALFDAINGLAGHVTAADKLMEFGAKYAVYLVVGLVIASWFVRTCPDEQRRFAVYTAVLAAVIALLITRVIQQEYVHQRPFVLRSDVTQLVSHSPDASFPSEHTTGAFALAVGLALYRLRWGLGLLALAVWIAFSRVYVGIHYPYDVLGGAGLGALCAGVLWFARPVFAWLDRQLVVRLIPVTLR